MQIGTGEAQTYAGFDGGFEAAAAPTAGVAPFGEVLQQPPLQQPPQQQPQQPATTGGFEQYNPEQYGGTGDFGGQFA